MPDETLEQRLRGHIATLSSEIGERNVFRPEALAAAAEYIRGRWRGQGYEVRAQEYVVSGIACENLEVTVTGTRNPSEIVLIGAHYDSVQGSPGANDNGSGIAGLLEIGRFLADASPPARTVRLVAFVNEEPPFFYWGQMGSQVYAKAARARRDDIRLMVSLEMLGCFSAEPGSQAYPPLLKHFYPNRGNFIAFVSNLRSIRALREAVAAFKANSAFPVESLAAPQWVPGVAWSDQLSFWQQGYQAIMVTDTAFYRYPYYHTVADTPDKIDYPSMARVVAGLQGAVARLTG